MTDSIRIEVDNDRVIVKSPYHPHFPPRARNLKGRWDPRAKLWTFDPRDEERVRRLVQEIYGTDGTDTETVTIRLSLWRSPDIRKSAIWAAGRRIVSRFWRDGSVSLGPGVVLISGKFPRSAGSRKYPSIANSPSDLNGVVVEVRDVPISLARIEVECGWAEIVDENRCEQSEVNGAQAEADKYEET